jgi:hypothetical protein
MMLEAVGCAARTIGGLKVRAAHPTEDTSNLFLMSHTRVGTFPTRLTSQKPSVMYDRYNAGRLQSTALTPFRSLFQPGESLDATHFFIYVRCIPGFCISHL